MHPHQFFIYHYGEDPVAKPSTQFSFFCCLDLIKSAISLATMIEASAAFFENSCYEFSNRVSSNLLGLS
jgi:hypothetical protein